MGAMKEMYQAINEEGFSPHAVEYAVMVGRDVMDVYDDSAAADRHARMIVENAEIIRGECEVDVRVVPFMQFEATVFSGERVGIQ